MPQNLRSRFGAIAALSTDIIPCAALPDPGWTDYSAWADTVWSDAPRVASQIDCI